MIQVVNKHHEEPTKLDVYVGRGSPLGNPTRINHRTTRQEAISSYEKYLVDKLNSKDKIVCDEMNRIYRLAKKEDVRLVCFCKPDACHADFIKKLIEQKL